MFGCFFILMPPKFFSTLLCMVITFWMLNKYPWINLLKVVVVGPTRENYKGAGWHWLMKGTASPPLRLVVCNFSPVDGELPNDGNCTCLLPYPG